MTAVPGLIRDLQPPRPHQYHAALARAIELGWLWPGPDLLEVHARRGWTYLPDARLNQICDSRRLGITRTAIAMLAALVTASAGATDNLAGQASVIVVTHWRFTGHASGWGIDAPVR